MTTRAHASLIDRHVVALALAGTSPQGLRTHVNDSEAADHIKKVSLVILLLCRFAPQENKIVSLCQVLAAIGALTGWLNLMWLHNLRAQDVKKVTASNMHWCLLAFTTIATGLAGLLMTIYILQDSLASISFYMRLFYVPLILSFFIPYLYLVVAPH
ncbi:hypothetical protein BDR04DRAFT_1113340 [Suillus decipiens]|nr:hypothetical protein BDR04DRAFT_1113340 [Suillus decipiens]